MESGAGASADGSGQQGGVHLDWAHTPGRCPLHIAPQSLAPKTERAVWAKGVTGECEGGQSITGGC